MFSPNRGSGGIGQASSGLFIPTFRSIYTRPPVHLDVPVEREVVVYNSGFVLTGSLQGREGSSEGSRTGLTGCTRKTELHHRHH